MHDLVEAELDSVSVVNPPKKLEDADGRWHGRLQLCGADDLCDEHTGSV